MASVDTDASRRAVRRYIKNAMKTPLLAAEEEFDLARRWREEADEDALHALTSAYLRLVVSMAGRFRNYGLPVADLVQEGNVGLMQAAARFEPERGVRFSTYASWWIRSSIQDFVLRNWSIVRTGTTAAHKSLFFNLRRLRALISDAGDANMTPEARASVARALKVSERDVEIMASRLAGADRSLNAPLGGDNDAEAQDMIADARPLPDEEVMMTRDAATRSRWLAAALKGLSPRELMIVQERRLTEDAVTLQDLGDRLGISKERVRQIEQQALRKLKTALVSIVGDPVESGLAP